jgi:LysR family hydrogen peroxide-inducible transcriptional activator
MDIRQLKFIDALMKERHFQRAAQRVHISQPSLSQGIKALERELGVALFERSSRWVKPTPAGEAFVEKARAAMEILNAAAEDVRQGAQGLGGTISIAAIPTLAPYVLPPVLKALRSKTTNLTMEVHELTTSLLLEHLNDGRVDVGILALPIDARSLVTKSVGSEPFFMAAHKKHPLSAKKFVRATDMAQEHLLILQEGHCFREQSLEVCRLSAEDPRVIFQGSSLGSVLTMASAGDGVTLVPRMAVDERSYPELAFRPFTPPAPTRDVGFAWRVTTPLRRAHHLFLELAEKEIGRLIGKTGR